MTFELLEKRHDRAAFDCGVESVNRYLRESARQQGEKKLAITTVMVSSPGESEILGFHTLVMSTLACALFPIKGLPRQHTAPVVLLAQFGVDVKHQGKGHGKRLLYHALSQSQLAAERVGCLAVTLHAVDEKAKEFYAGRGFRELIDDPFHLWLPMSEVQDMFSSDDPQHG